MKKYLLVLVCFYIVSCSKTKEEIITEPEIEIEATTTEVETTSASKKETGLVFMVQIAALKNENKTLESLADIHLTEENNLTKYRFGPFNTYNEATELKNTIRKIYSDAFVQALFSNQPIHITEALAK